MNEVNHQTHFTDLANADYFVGLFSDIVRYDHMKKKWFIWNEHYWRQDNNGEITRLAIQSLDKRLKAVSAFADEDMRKKAVAWVLKSEGADHLSRIIRIATSLSPVAITGKEWDKRPLSLACMNGVIDLETGEFNPGISSDMIRQHVNISYDPKAECPRFLSFVEEIFEDNNELIYYMQKALGYSITGINSEQVIFFCHGTGSNGKSVLFSVLSKILGSFATTLPSATFHRNAMNTQTNDIASLNGKRFVIASEALSLAKLDEQKLKKISGGDTMSARFLHQEFFEFEPICKIWMFFNHHPRVDDDTNGFWRRVRLIPFTRTFTGKELDLNLIPKLEEELPGILNWLIQGALIWKAEGLNPTPDIVTAATNEFKESNNVLTDFINEYCDQGEQYSDKASTLYSGYVKWANIRNLQRADILTNTMFGRLLTDNYKKIKAETGTFYKGIALKLQNTF